MANRLQSSCLIRGVVLGAFSGLAASWVMNNFIAVAVQIQQTAKPAEQKAQDESQNDQASEDSTVKVADTLTWLVTGHHLSNEGKQKSGPIVHYGFGTLMGAVYGALAELSGTVTAGSGSAFGAALFLGADEVMVPAVGLGKFPTQEPASSQLIHLAAHVVYGTTTELVRRCLAWRLR